MHPWAWWAWAMGLAVATTRASHPLVVVALLAAAVLVVLVRRDGSPWARAFPAYLVLGAAIVAFRVVFHVLVGLKAGEPVLLDLPRIRLPEWAAGIQLLGPVTLPGVLGAAAEGLRLATLVVCFGAANALANPRRALRSLPAALHQVGTAVVIAMSVAPQLITSAVEVRRARRLRGHDERGLRALLGSAVPVLQDALDRSLELAASMDSRGYARALPGRTDRRVGALLLVALLAAAWGSYGLLDGTAPRWMGLPVLALGAATAVAGTVLAGRRVRRTRYRPDVWDAGASAVAAAGVGTALLALLGPAAGAAVPVLAVGCALLGAAPAVAGLRTSTASSAASGTDGLGPDVPGSAGAPAPPPWQSDEVSLGRSPDRHADGSTTPVAAPSGPPSHQGERAVPR